MSTPEILMWLVAAAAFMLALRANTHAGRHCHHLGHLSDDLEEVREAVGLPRFGERCDLPAADDPGEDR